MIQPTKYTASIYRGDGAGGTTKGKTKQTINNMHHCGMPAIISQAWAV
jgi:hypothetical protein